MALVARQSDAELHRRLEWFAGDATRRAVRVTLFLCYAASQIVACAAGAETTGLGKRRGRAEPAGAFAALQTRKPIVVAAHTTRPAPSAGAVDGSGAGLPVTDAPDAELPSADAGIPAGSEVNAERRVTGGDPALRIGETGLSGKRAPVLADARTLGIRGTRLPVSSAADTAGRAVGTTRARFTLLCAAVANRPAVPPLTPELRECTVHLGQFAADGIADAKRYAIGWANAVGAVEALVAAEAVV